MVSYHALEYVRVHSKGDSVDVIKVINQLTLKDKEIILDYLGGPNLITLGL